MVDDALKLFVSNKAGEAGTDLQPTHRAEVFQDRETDRREPDLRPGKWRHHEKGEEFPAKNLIANRLVEKGPCGKTYGPPLALIENTLGFEEQSLAEPFVPMTMNLSSRSERRKPSISGVRWSKDSLKSSATWMSSASTVHARMRSPPCPARG